MQNKSRNILLTYTETVWVCGQKVGGASDKRTLSFWIFPSLLIGWLTAPAADWSGFGSIFCQQKLRISTKHRHTSGSFFYSHGNRMIWTSVTSAYRKSIYKVCKKSIVMEKWTVLQNGRFNWLGLDSAVVTDTLT